MKPWILLVIAEILALSFPLKAAPTATPSAKASHAPTAVPTQIGTPPPAGPVKTSFRFPIDVEQGTTGHPVNGNRPFQMGVKLGPALDIRGWQIEPAWVLLRFPTGGMKGGACLRVSKLIWEPGGRRLGLRFLVDGSYFGGKNFVGQCGPVLDLNGLLRLGFLAGVGHAPNDHFFGMTTVGIDLVSWGKLLAKAKPTPGPFDHVDY